MASERAALVTAARLGDVATVASMLGIELSPSEEDSQAAPRLKQEEQWVRARRRLVNGKTEGTLQTPMVAAATMGKVSWMGKP